MEKLQKRVEQLEWDNHLLTVKVDTHQRKFWKCNNELRAWENWYNNCFEEDVQRSIKHMHAVPQQYVQVLGTGEQVTHNSGGESDYG